ncbi:MAG: hypothetical protein ACI9M6_001009, partial [Hydrogenophaga sp.]
KAKGQKSRHRTGRGGFHARPERSGGATDHLVDMQSATTFHLPSWICDMREALLPSRSVGLKVISPVPNMSGEITMVSTALMKLSVVRLAPALPAALRNASISW